MRLFEINEQPYQPVESNAIEFLKQHKEVIKSYALNGDYIYRGMNGTHDVIMVDGSLMKRKSANTTNEFTTITEFLPSWKNWPKRSQSLICSTNFSQAMAYGSNKSSPLGRLYYFIIPLENQPIAMASDSDIWDSFDSGILKLFDDAFTNKIPAFNRVIRAYVDIGADLALEYPSDTRVSRLSNSDGPVYLKHTLLAAQTVIRENPEAALNIRVSELVERPINVLLEQIIAGKDIIDLLNQALDPEYNGCTLFKNISTFNSQPNREIWLSGKCLCIGEALFKDILNGKHEGVFA